MKLIRIILVAILSVGILLAMSSAAYADDPPDPSLDVDIDITGEGADIGVNVNGDNSKINVGAGSNSDVNINGTPLSQFGMSAGYGNAQTQLQCWQNQKDLKWLLEQLATTNSYLGLTANGVAKLITELQAQGKTLEESVQWVSDNREELEVIASQLDSYSTRFTAMGNNTFALWQEVNSLKNATQEQAQTIAKLENQNKTEYFAGVGLGAVLLLGIVTALVYRRRSG